MDQDPSLVTAFNTNYFLRRPIFKYSYTRDKGFLTKFTVKHKNSVINIFKIKS